MRSEYSANNALEIGHAYMARQQRLQARNARKPAAMSPGLRRGLWTLGTGLCMLGIAAATKSIGCGVAALFILALLVRPY